MRLRPHAYNALDHVCGRRFDKARSEVHTLREYLEEARKAASADDDVLRDLYALEQYAALLESYVQLWEEVLAREFAASWHSLQNALDSIRLIKKYSNLNVRFFEEQLQELEGAYPYRLFLSIGAVVHHFECSVCGLDIDGEECDHRRGDLHRGHMVYGIARQVTNLDHVSLVLYPEDKRCVITLEDVPDQFPVVNYMAQLVESGRMQICTFDRLAWSKRQVPNRDHIRLGRNDPCYCGSKKKFKRCCEGSATIEQDHVDVLAAQRDLRSVVV